tara:strand:- start:399 stop:686 length:288 start_codon:yes stop_codon:yes gene_type:complete
MCAANLLYCPPDNSLFLIIELIFEALWKPPERVIFCVFIVLLLVVCFELQALGVGADQGYAVAVALGVALANNDVSVGVYLCCVHCGFAPVMPSD